MTDIRRAAELLQQAAQYGGVLVVVGAGLSAPSGIATFRRGGQSTPMWQRGPALSLEDWQRSPERVWGFIEQRIGNARGPDGDSPVPSAHRPLARLLGRLATLREGGARLTIVNQNIDLLLDQALEEELEALQVPRDLWPDHLHVHGSLSWRCSACGVRGPLQESRPPEYCPQCGAAHERWKEDKVRRGVRPDVVLFGEQLPAAFGPVWDSASGHDCCLIAGSSLEVTPVGNLPREVSLNGGHLLVCDEVLPERLLWTPKSQCSWLGGDIQESLSRLQAEVERQLQTSGDQ